MKDEFNKLATLYGKLLSRQSHKEYERATFPEGITSSTKKFGTEERCRLLLFLLIHASVHGETFHKAMQLPGRIYSIILVCSHLLLLEHFFRETEISRQDIFQLRFYMPIFMTLFASAIRRKVGVAMNFVKFHLLLHFVEDLSRWGIALVFDGSYGESHHKGFKRDAERTQKRASKMDRQMARQYQNRHTVGCAINELEANSPLPTSTTAERRDALIMPGLSFRNFIDHQQRWTSIQEGTLVSGYKFLVTSKGMFHAPKRDKQLRQAKWIDEDLRHRVTDYLQGEVLPHIKAGSCIRLFTKFNMGKTKLDGMAYYHANPNDGQDGLETSPVCGRHDWVNIFKGELPDDTPEAPMKLDQLIPHRVMIFFVVSGLQTPTDSVPTDGVYAVCTNIASSLYQTISAKKYKQHPFRDLRADPVCPLVYWSPMVTRASRATRGQTIHRLKIVRPLVHFHSPQIAIPYNLNDAKRDEWLFLIPRSRWTEIFRGGMEEIFNEELKRRRTHRKNIARRKKLALTQLARSDNRDEDDDESIESVTPDDRTQVTQKIRSGKRKAARHEK
jgi:hypothetical protein